MKPGLCLALVLAAAVGMAAQPQAPASFDGMWRLDLDRSQQPLPGNIATNERIGMQVTATQVTVHRAGASMVLPIGGREVDIDEPTAARGAQRGSAAWKGAALVITARRRDGHRIGQTRTIVVEETFAVAGDVLTVERVMRTEHGDGRVLTVPGQNPHRRIYRREAAK